MHELYAMATVCRKKDGYGLFMYVTGGDHNPPHVHVEDLDGNELAKMIITEETPQSIDDLFRVKGSTSFLTTRQKKAIVDWANADCKLRNMTDFTNWERTQIEWEGENGNLAFPSIKSLTLQL